MTEFDAAVAAYRSAQDRFDGINGVRRLVPVDWNALAEVRRLLVDPENVEMRLRALGWATPPRDLPEGSVRTDPVAP